MQNDMWLMEGDCLEKMKEIPDGSVDMILCDLPYGTTECDWDVVIPFDSLWEQYRRLVTETGAIILFAQQPFTSKLILSSDLFRYSLVWKKSRVSRFTQANYRFLNEHEDIVVFSFGKCSANSKIKMRYFPQGLIPIEPKICKNHDYSLRPRRTQASTSYTQNKTGYPKSILSFSSVANPIHPTQKPVSLLEYLIKTYTNENEVVLDNCMGSGSTGVACVKANRKFIGIEKDEKYIQIARERISDAILEKEDIFRCHQ
jgi:site-specific DNA-methyltransferase (adenine-specific)